VTMNPKNKQWLNVDLHVHSIRSNRPKEFMLRAFGSGECYTQPAMLYQICHERGMDLVTITDHDNIEGALEIAHLPGTFLSEEITAVFPEDKTNVHVVAWDITEAQHLEIQRLRENLYDLAKFLRAEHLPHFVCHPLSEVRNPISAWHVQRLVLLFKHLEGKNGTRDVIHGDALRRLVDGLTPELLVKWANQHDLEPVDWDPRRYLTGGSDDHGRLNIARAFTRFHVEEPTVAELRRAFFAGEIEAGGEWGTSEVLSHNIYSIVFQAFMRHSSRSAYGDILSMAGVQTKADELAPPPTNAKEERRREVMRIVAETVAELPDFDPTLISQAGHTDAAQGMMGRLGRGLINNLFKKFLGNLVAAASAVDFEEAIDQIPGLISSATLIVPYCFGYRFQVRDRNESERIVAELGFGYAKDRPCKVAIFTDTGYDVNGVALGLRHMVGALRELGHHVELVVSATPPEHHVPDHLEQMGGLRQLAPLVEFELPAYEEMTLGVPSLADLMDYLAREEISVIQVSTPGPLGLVALIAGKLLGLPVVAHYHTELPEYALSLTRDRAIASLVKGWTSWFYRQAARVIVPSQATARSVRQLGIDEDKIFILPRGVDTSLFTAAKRNPTEWGRFGMNGARKLLYVGRVSREKGLDLLMDAFHRLRAERDNVELVIVGDGPYKEQLEQSAADDHKVVFVGYQRGEQLARLYASADVFVFPSATDTFGNVVLEAQASGVPVVVVNRGGPAEQVKPGINGCVVDPNDPEQMAEAIAGLLDDQDLRTRMGKAGRRRALALSLKRAAQAQWELYESIWGRGERTEGSQWTDEELERYASRASIYSRLS
jgi:glycosyltransferase involved in cell wall biosynthesis/predicted metal-dependent phosphoesterase TrpH